MIFSRVTCATRVIFLWRGMERSSSNDRLNLMRVHRRGKIATQDCWGLSLYAGHCVLEFFAGYSDVERNAHAFFSPGQNRLTPILLAIFGLGEFAQPTQPLR